ncbi:Aste57867_21322 [Aphanomyces stellatus]|uniref:Aste57867_21322 protein n=1 Tax=Aphanomyces stellatus TaxID=120398 RepID=A0A485LJA9_9STRA|nr:hypothetical protein As57867_021253 [Aphanomyces stellatus]VFT97994.1 Aste57867_21322 [Aphanomyces stellatus]
MTFYVATCLFLVAATSMDVTDATIYRPLDHHRIVGGTPASDFGFPWMAGIRTTPTGNASCAGTLIAPNYILTAAQCMSFYRFTPPVFYVAIGSPYLNGTGAENITVTDFWIHPQFIPYHPTTFRVGLQYDVAILKLSTPSSKTPIRLGSDQVQANTPASVLGWGAISPNDSVFSPMLKQAKATILDDNDCEARIRASNYSNFDQWNITASHVCAGGIKDTGVCRGDAGGPLVVQSAATGGFVLVGDVSFGGPCASGIPDVYGRLTGVREFIDHRVSGHQWVSQNAS